MKARPSHSLRRSSLDGFQLDEEHVTASTVLQKEIDWFSYAQDLGQGVWIEEEDAMLISDFDGAPLADQKALWEENERSYALAFTRALTNISIEDTLQYILTLLSQFIDMDPSKCSSFAVVLQFQGHEYSPIPALMSIIDRSNYHSYTLQTASRIFASVLSSMDNAESNAELPRLVLWIKDMLSHRSHSLADVSIALETLKELAKNVKIQKFLVDHNVLLSIGALMDSKLITNNQVAYLVGFCLWLFSFNEFSHDALVNGNIVDRICKVMKLMSREKVVRIMSACLRNLIGKRNFNQVMILGGLPKVLKLLESRKWNDEDIVEDLDLVKSALDTEIEEMSTFEMFQKELSAGKLHWSQIHTERFWKENVDSCEKNDFKSVRMLVNLLESEDEETVAVACYDLGEFVRLYPGGKKIVSRLKGKEKLMLQMSHTSQQVQKQALLAVQKLMVNNWTFLAQS